MITLDEVTRKYNDFAAVDQVSFTISPGEIVGLLGHNGAGKTTIMKMMTGYLEPTSGSITIDGKSVGSQRRLVQSNVGYLPENCPLYPEMTVIDFLDYVAALRGLSLRDRTHLIAEAIKQTELADKATQPIATLSRGYRQRTGVAQAILHKPGIYILDEPTNGLDPTQIQQMRDLINSLAQQATVIISTHILQEVQAVCDRVIILKDGKIALDSRLDVLQISSRLIVRTDARSDRVMELFENMTEISGVDEIAPLTDDVPGYCYGLTLVGGSNRHATAAIVAKSIHENGMQLYTMDFENRNLETVFADISRQ